MDIRISEYRLAVDEIYDCQVGALAGVTKVRADDGSEEYEVYAFDISGHAAASRCYVWAMPVNASKVVFRCVLNSESVTSAESAVQFAAAGEA